MKKPNIIVILIILCLMLSGCNISKKVNPNENVYNIDNIYDKIKEANFSKVQLVELNYNQINKTAIMVGDQAFEKRESLVDEKGLSTQRILCYSMDDGTQINVILGYLFFEGKTEKNMITLYNDDLKSIGQPYSDDLKLSTHADSSVFLLENILINILSVNVDTELDTLSIILFKEEFIQLLNSTTLNN